VKKSRAIDCVLRSGVSMQNMAPMAKFQCATFLIIGTLFSKEKYEVN